MAVPYLSQLEKLGVSFSDTLASEGRQLCLVFARAKGLDVDLPLCPAEISRFALRTVVYVPGT